MMEAMKCCIKGCERRGVPLDGFDFYLCDACADDLGRRIDDLWFLRAQDIHPDLEVRE